MKIRVLLSGLLLVLFVCPHTTAQTVAVKSNALSAVLGSVNAGVEVALGRRITLEGYGSIRPWERQETSVKKYWLAQTEVRHWFCQKFNGAFIGAFVNGAQFNMGGKKLPFGLFPDLERHRYEGYLLGGGATYGYQVMLNAHWNVECSVSAGYEFVHYKRYRCPRECAGLDKVDNYHYVGPTKASVSLIYLF